MRLIISDDYFQLTSSSVPNTVLFSVLHIMGLSVYFLSFSRFLVSIFKSQRYNLNDEIPYSHFSVFWDLYCAAPERRDVLKHSPDARAFYDYVSSYVALSLTALKYTLIISARLWAPATATTAPLPICIYLSMFG